MVGILTQARSSVSVIFMPAIICIAFSRCGSLPMLLLAHGRASCLLNFPFLLLFSLFWPFFIFHFPIFRSKNPLHNKQQSVKRVQKYSTHLLGKCESALTGRHRQRSDGGSRAAPGSWQGFRSGSPASAATNWHTAASHRNRTQQPAVCSGCSCRSAPGGSARLPGVDRLCHSTYLCSSWNY